MSFDIYQDTIVLCVIAKHEQLYIDEWIQYHLYLGFDHIYIYDNEEGNPLKKLTNQYPSKVTVIPFIGQCQQMNAYYHFLMEYRYKHTWVAFIDIDEFIVIKRYQTIQDLVKNHCHTGALALNWVLFGSNHEGMYKPLPVLQRFTKRQIGVNEHIKWIVRTNDIDYMVSPHHGLLRYGVAKDCHDIVVQGPYNPQGSDSIACIHHYFTKSREEFQYKCLRGRADIPEVRTFSKDFDRHDLNEIEDSSAWDFFQRKNGC